MLKPEIMLLGVLLLLAGCYTRPLSPAIDWTAPQPAAAMELEHVADAPVIAPPQEPLSLPPIPPALRTNLSFAETWISLNRWLQQNGGGAINQISLAPARMFSLLTSNGLLTIQPRSLSARWDGVEFRLGFEPQLVDDQLFVHVLDLRKNLEPLLRGLPPVTKTNRVLVLDPGHGGGNTGTRSLSDGTEEKTFTLDWARRLESLLATNGWQVFLTRTNDAEMPLSARVAFADEHRADLFISLHFNSAAPSREQSGLETYCLTPAGMRSTLIREYEDNPSLTFTNNAFDAENLQYAMRLHRSLLRECSFADRGVRRARFLGVLRGQNRPAVLIEGGFLSNPADARHVADAEFRQKMAAALANALQ